MTRCSWNSHSCRTSEMVRSSNMKASSSVMLIVLQLLPLSMSAQHTALPMQTAGEAEADACLHTASSGFLYGEKKYYLRRIDRQCRVSWLSSQSWKGQQLRIQALPCEHPSTHYITCHGAKTHHHIQYCAMGEILWHQMEAVRLAQYVMQRVVLLEYQAAM